MPQLRPHCQRAGGIASMHDFYDPCRIRFLLFVVFAWSRYRPPTRTEEIEMSIQSSIAGDTSLPRIVFNRIATAIKAAMIRRAQRMALGELFAMSPGRLHDLGINAGDIIEALEAAPPVGEKLATRRADRSDCALGLSEPKTA
jgi:uncharacterized protein YjiS (DUF1127 family)